MGITQNGAPGKIVLFRVEVGFNIDTETARTPPLRMGGMIAPLWGIPRKHRAVTHLIAQVGGANCFHHY